MSHEADPRPLFVKEAARRAEREGKTLQQVLDGDRERLHAARYPGRDCLDPDDIQALLTPDAAAPADARTDGFLGHVEGCDHCATLLMLSEPPQRPLDAVLREARQRAGPEMVVAAVTAAPRGATAEGPDTQVPLDVASTVAPSLLVLGWIALARAGSVEARPLLVLLAVTVLLGLGAWWISRLPSVRGTALQYSLGAIAGGVSLAIAGLILSNASAHQLSNAETAALAMAKDTANDQVFDVLETRQATLRFPLVASPKRSLVMHARAMSPDKAVYVAAENWFPGELVAEVTPQSAELRLKGDAQDQLLSRFVVGKVTLVDKSTLALSSGGRTYPLSTLGGGAPAEGSDVVAATDPAGKVLSFRQIGPLAAQAK